MGIKVVNGVTIVTCGYLLGYEENGEEIRGFHIQDQIFEDHLLTFRTSPWQKFLAKYFGSRICLGYFKKVGDKGFMNWYLFWCERCKRFQVNYKSGFGNSLDCKSCQDNFLCSP